MRTLIVCNGETPSRALLEQEVAKSTLIIAADGGANILLDVGIMPTVVVGDLDSFNTPEKYPFEIIRDADQETNDLEKALGYALEQGAGECVVLGALGLRMDHALKNLSALQKFDDQFTHLMYRDDRQSVFVLPRVYEGTYDTGTVISLFPISGKVEGIVTKGLAYPLNNEVLENGIRDGSSNHTIEEHIRITYSSGVLLAFVRIEPSSV